MIDLLIFSLLIGLINYTLFYVFVVGHTDDRDWLQDCISTEIEP